MRLTNLSKSINKYHPGLIAWISVITILFIIHTRGMMLNDEGYILQSAQRIASGEIIYKDFFIAYTPLTPLITALSFIFLGESIISARLTALTASLLTLIFIYKTVSLITKKELLRWTPVLFFMIWGPFHINFSWPVIYTSFTGIATCYYLLLAQKEKAKKYYFLAGLMSILTFLFKQNFGIASLAIVGVYFLLNKKARKKENLVHAALGLLLPLLIWGIYTISTNSEIYLVENFYFYFYQKLVVEGVDQTPFIYPGSFLNMTAKFLFYVFPLAISLFATLITWKKKKEFVIIPLFASLYYLTGIRPVTDYVHYTPLLAVSGLSLFLLMIFMKGKRKTFFLYALYFTLLITGLYASLFRAYYRWEAPIISNNYLLENRKINVLVDKKYNVMLTDMETYIDKNTVKNEYIFVDYYSPSLYFILDRKNPTRFIYLSPNVVDYKYQREIEKNLEDRKVNLIITSYLLRQDKSHLSQYIKINYKLDKVMHNYMFWQKKQ